MNTEFVGIEIPENRARALIAEIIRDAIQEYARCLVRRENGLPFSFREMSDCEDFLSGKDFVNYSELISFNVSGRKLIELIRANPRQYFKCTGSSHILKRKGVKWSEERKRKKRRAAR
jgi:hypothetical protein